MPNPQIQNLDVTSKLVLDEADEMLGHAVQMIRRSHELAHRATSIAIREAAGQGVNKVSIAVCVSKFSGRIADLELNATQSLCQARKQLDLDLKDATEETE